VRPATDLSCAARALLALVSALLLASACWAQSPGARVNALWERARTQVSAGKLRYALATAHEAVHVAPHHHWAWWLLGWVHDQRDEWPQCEAAYRKALSLRPSSAMLHYNVGVALDRQGNNGEAIRYYEQAIRLDNYPEAERDAHINLGWLLHRLGRRDEAITHYQAALALDPNDALAHSNLGWAYHQQGDLEAAVGEYRQALSADPALAIACNNVGLALYELGRVEEARAQYRRAIELDNDPEAVTYAHTNLGDLYRDEGKLDQAIGEYRRAVATDPKYASAHHGLGVALGEQGQLDQAIAELHEALSLDEPPPACHAALAYLLLQQGQSEPARAELAAASEDLSDEEAGFELLYFAGKTYAALQDSEQAAALFRRAVELRPTHRWSEEMRAYLEPGR
jgi:tetratricopeptide (TPR) repeat protein